ARSLPVRTSRARSAWRRRRSATICLRIRKGPLLRLYRQRQRRLAEDVAPAVLRPHVGGAAPELSLDGFALAPALDPQKRRDDGRVAPDADVLLELVLLLVDRRLVAGFFEEVSLRESLSSSRDEHEVVGQDEVHRRRVVVLDGVLVPGVECRDFLGVVFR